MFNRVKNAAKNALFREENEETGQSTVNHVSAIVFYLQVEGNYVENVTGREQEIMRSGDIHFNDQGQQTKVHVTNIFCFYFNSKFPTATFQKFPRFSQNHLRIASSQFSTLYRDR